MSTAIQIAGANAKVEQIHEELDDDHNGHAQAILDELKELDPERVLVFAQQSEIAYLEGRVRTLGRVLEQCDSAREIVLTEFRRLMGRGVDVNEDAIAAIRGCLVERTENSE